MSAEKERNYHSGEGREVEVSGEKGLPVKVDRRGRVLERDKGEEYNGPGRDTPVYTDRDGNVVTGKGNVKLTPVQAYIDPNGTLYASNGRYDVVFAEDKQGRLHTVYSLRKQEDGVAERVAGAVAISGILLGLLGLSPIITGNAVAGQDVVADWSASAFLIIGLLAVIVYLVKSRHSKVIASKRSKVKSRLR